MNCKKCGNVLNEGDKFCGACGEEVKLDQTNNYQVNQVISNSNENINLQNTSVNETLNMDQQKKKSVFGLISIIIGVVTIIASIFLNIYVIPVGIAGLVLGILEKQSKPKKIVGIVINGVAILTCVTAFVVVVVLKEFFFGPVVGKYDCKDVVNQNGNYLITLELYNDGTFLYGPYNRLENNYAKGTYTVEKENKTNYTKDYSYYMITMHGKKENFVVDGVARDSDFNSKMEFGITTKNGKKSGVILFLSNYNTYYCYER